MDKCKKKNPAYRRKRPRIGMGFFIFGKAHTGPLYEFLPSADIGQVVY
jgi:hypothetical protein